jgi:Retinoic acid induced 16-like protein/Family of unknown function (DUF5917)
VDSDDEEFLMSNRFSKALTMFVDRTCGSGNLFVGEETECEIIELIFGIAAKIRLQPELLTVWFNASKRLAGDHQSKRANFVGLTSKDDFPLCYQLIDHVHHEGRMGDFARTGLLYIFETASKSPQLEQWIAESDLPTLMASGLGALYSQLSRKLSILHPPKELPVILQLSDYSALSAPPDAESLFSEYLQEHLKTFLSYLTFWQDVLEHCSSIDVKQTLLDHFQILFLQQLLYPSLLESSDSDGGSSVAVLTYITRILEVIDHPDFVHLILQYLLALPESNGIESSVASLHAMKKRKSLLLLSKVIDDEDDEASPALFNLADLLQGSIRSLNPQTVIAAFKLIAVLLNKDHPYTVGTLLRSERIHHDSVQRTHGALNAELAAYISVAEEIAGSSGMDESYESHVKDVQIHVELHCCSASLLTLESLGIPVPTHPLDLTILHPRAPLPLHSLQQGDRLFEHLIFMLDNFLTNNIEVNLMLTDVILTLASCPQLKLEDWLAVNPNHYKFAPDSDSSSKSTDNHLQNIKLARREPTWSSDNSPALLKSFQKLHSQIMILKDTVPSLSQLINTRKQAFRLHDEISEATLSASQQITSSASKRPPSPLPMSPPPRPSLSLQSRLFGGSSTPSKSRSRSPRGRTAARGLEQGPTSSPSPTPHRSLLASPVRSSPIRASPSRHARQTGPIVVGHTPEDLLNDIIEGANSELLVRKIRFPLKEETVAISGQEQHVEDQSDVNRGAQTDPTTTQSASLANDEDDDIVIVSLSHILTNIVVLQEFILELAAVMQVRASLFGEVKFSEP